VTIFSNQLGEQMPYDGVSPVAWRIASYVLATREDGTVLAIEPPWRVRWEPPGGAVELDESVLDAAIRECWEAASSRPASIRSASSSTTTSRRATRASNTR
jgi:8-oxo-dGTP pyrophosphatase MutT (NUDIX family)